MAYYPGSHRLGLDRYINIFGEEVPDDIGDDPALRGVHPVLVEVPVGAVAFHHGLTAHFALANRTAATRRIHEVIYLADGCHRAGFPPHPCVDLDHIRVDAKVDGAFTPVLWPDPTATCRSRRPTPTPASTSLAARPRAAPPRPDRTPAYPPAPRRRRDLGSGAAAVRTAGRMRRS